MVKRPWSVQIELVEGCNRLCSFCGLNSIRSRPGEDIRYMNGNVLTALCEQLPELCPDVRYEFAMHGEPTLHPQLLAYIGALRYKLPKAQFQLTTNGKTLLSRGFESYLLEIFNAGIDIVVLDTYYPERDKLHKAAFSVSNDIIVYDFYEDVDCPSPYSNHHGRVKTTLIVMDDISSRSGESKIRKLNNQAGNAGDGSVLNLKKTCTLPFRELSIRRDGDVCICCMDVGHEYVCGNVLGRSVADIWYGPEFEAARKVLYSRNRSFSPCARCDASAGTRVGLLPKYRAPSSDDWNVLTHVLDNCCPRNNYERIYV